MSVREAEVADLNELRVLLEAIKLVLARQRAAIAKLDSNELAEASSEKRHIADAFAVVRQAMRKTENADAELLELRADVSRLATSIRIDARSNQALLADASHMIGHVLGTESVGSGYDRRARRSTEPRTSFAKAV